MPDASEAVRPDIAGSVGFPFRLDTTLGNLTLYALAGIEDRSVSPPKFTPYAMGVVHGVSASPGETTNNVFIPIDIPLDHTVQVAATTPAPGSRGPDRAGFSVAVEVEKSGYAIVPAGAQSQVLPVNRALSFVGLPALSGALSGTRYIASATAGTGPLLAAPLSAVGAFASTSESIALATFVPLPLLDYPSFGGAWDGRRLSVSFAPTTTTVDITCQAPERRRPGLVARRGARWNANHHPAQLEQGVPASARSSPATFRSTSTERTFRVSTTATCVTGISIPADSMRTRSTSSLLAPNDSSRPCHPLFAVALVAS